jgi:hypothetical protein
MAGPDWGKHMPEQASCDFNSIPLESGERNPCSPRFESFAPSIQGILINAPASVEAAIDPDRAIISASTRLPVCISMQFPLKYISKFCRPRTQINLVMTNQKTGESFSSYLTYSRPMTPNPNMDIPKDILEIAMDRRYFTVNATEYLQLQPMAGTYTLYASFNEYRSNVLTVSVTLAGIR